MRTFTVVLLSLAACVVHADEQTRAKQNYQLNCMGCHAEDGAGLESQVPSLRGTLSRISSGVVGRDYVLRVPGVTQSTLSSKELAEVLNWAIDAFSDAQDAKEARPFTATEVENARTRPLLEIGPVRAKALSEAGS